MESLVVMKILCFTAFQKCLQFFQNNLRFIITKWKAEKFWNKLPDKDCQNASVGSRNRRLGVGLKQAPKASKAWGPQRGARLEVAILVASGRASSLDWELDSWRKQQVRLVKVHSSLLSFPQQILMSSYYYKSGTSLGLRNIKINRICFLNVTVAHNLVRNHLPCLPEHLNVPWFQLLLWASTPPYPWSFLLSVVHSGLQSWCTNEVMTKMGAEMWWNRVHFSSSKVSGQGDGKSSTFASSPSCEFSLIHLFFWFTIHGKHLNTSYCPEWLRTANLE